MSAVFFSPLQVTELEKIIENSLSRVLAKPDMSSPEDPDTGSEVFNIDEAAAFLRMPKSTLHIYASKRKIPYCKPGKALLFLKTDLIDWLKKHRHKTDKEILADAANNLTAANTSTKK